MKEQLYELTCRFDPRKSFYGKATVKTHNINGSECNVLFSYGTFIANMEPIYNKNIVRITFNTDICSLWSQTTGRHLKEWLLQSDVNVPRLLKNFEAKNLKDLIFNKMNGIIIFAPTL